VLVLAAQDLHMICQKHVIPYRDEPSSGKGADVHTMAHHSARPSEHAPDANETIQGATFECHPVICVAKVAPGEARNETEDFPLPFEADISMKDTPEKEFS
jgi:hypothetical protein